jgi:hypothetical protein
MHQTTRHNLHFASQTLSGRVAFMGGEQISEHAPNHQAQPAFASQTLSERVAFHGWSVHTRQLFNHGVKPLHHHQTLRFTHSKISEHATNHQAHPAFPSQTLSERFLSCGGKPLQHHQKLRFTLSIISEHAPN